MYTDTILTFHMWSQIEPIMAIVCACITTFRPLFAGIDLKLMTYLNWNGRRTASSSLAKTKGRWPDRRNDPESDLKKAKRMRSLSGCREGDLEMLNLDQVVHTQTLGNIRFIKSAESLKRADSWQGEGQSTTARVKTEESFV